MSNLPTSALVCVLVAASAAAQTAGAPPVPAQAAKPATPMASPEADAKAPPSKARPRSAKHKPLPAAVLRVAEANAAAKQSPTRQNYINATQVYAFSDGALYQVFAAPERVTDIQLQPGERLIAVAAGDTARWVIGDTVSGTGAAQRTHVLLKPYATELATNLVITTDRRSYHLALNSTAGAAMASLSWTYPADTLLAVQHAAAAAERVAPVAAGLALEELCFDYRIEGDTPAWRPLRAFDDGRQTFVEFPADLGVGEAPPLFLVDGKGEAQLVNYRVRGRYYVVDRLFAAAELRLGTKQQQVVRIVRVAQIARTGRAS